MDPFSCSRKTVRSPPIEADSVDVNESNLLDTNQQSCRLCEAFDNEDMRRVWRMVSLHLRRSHRDRKCGLVLTVLVSLGVVNRRLRFLEPTQNQQSRNIDPVRMKVTRRHLQRGNSYSYWGRASSERTSGQRLFEQKVPGSKRFSWKWFRRRVTKIARCEFDRK